MGLLLSRGGPPWCAGPPQAPACPGSMMRPRRSIDSSAHSRESTHKGARHAAAPRRSGDASTRVYQALRQQILNGDLPAGNHLNQQALAVAMETSNGPVISAL